MNKKRSCLRIYRSKYGFLFEFFSYLSKLLSFRQCKDAQAQLLLLKRTQMKSSKTLVTPMRFISKAETSEVFLDALSIPPALLPKNMDVIDEGRYGRCTKAFLHGIVVCIKTLRCSTCQAKSLVTHEAMMLSKVRHPNIAFLIGVQTTDYPFQLITAFYSIMGLGVSVYDTLCDTVGEKKHAIELLRPALTLKVWFTLMKDLADALAFMHNKSIIHRDLKSDNVVLNQASEVVQCILVDFGKSNYVRKVMRYQLTKEERDVYRRDHKHIAPDLVDGISDVTTACDMYSYGRLLKNVINYFPLPTATIPMPTQQAIKKCLKYNYQQTT